MISSRNDAIFDNKSLTEIRKKLKKQIEDSKLFDNKIFEVTINEDEPARDNSKDLWQRCMEYVERCDILLVLYNGDSGWTVPKGQIGICHDELRKGMNINAHKVFIINIGEVKLDRKGSPKRKRDEERRDSLC